MARTSKINLGGEEFTVHAFNLGELERISDIMSGPSGRVGFNILRIAMERAEPKPENIDALEMTLDEISAASLVLMELAGLTVKKGDDADPPKGQETGGA